MNDYDKVKGTEFDNVYMVGRILSWFLIMLFDDRNKDYENLLRSIVSSNGSDAELALIPHIHQTVFHFYEMFREIERREQDGDSC